MGYILPGTPHPDRLCMRFAVFALFAALPALSAADVAERPLYFAVELLPSDFRSTVTSDNGSFNGHDSALNVGVAAGLRWSFAPVGWSHGPVVGVEAAVESATFDNGGHQVAELRGLAGWAVAVDRRWVVQLSLRGGYGLSRLQLGVEGGSDVDEGGRGWSLEPNVEVLWAFSERGRLSLGGGWRTSHYTYAGNGLDINLVNDGPTIRIGIEWQLSVAPKRLR